MPRRHPIRALVITALALIVAAPMAAAQVTVDPDEAERGGFATLTSNVPNERDDASTTALEVNRPTDTPIQFVSMQPKPGWEYQVEARTPPHKMTSTTPPSSALSASSSAVWPCCWQHSRSSGSAAREAPAAARRHLKSLNDPTSA
jgi:hypothetical protein